MPQHPDHGTRCVAAGLARLRRRVRQAEAIQSHRNSNSSREYKHNRARFVELGILPIRKATTIQPRNAGTMNPIVPNARTMGNCLSLLARCRNASELESIIVGT